MAVNPVENPLPDASTRKAASRVLALAAHPDRKVSPALVDAQCAKHCGENADEAAEVIRSWLEWHGPQVIVGKESVAAVFAWLREELAARVDDELVWALATLDPREVSEQVGQTSFGPKADAAIASVGSRAVRSIAESDDILLHWYFGRDRHVTKDGIVHGGPLRVLEHTDRFSELVYAVVPSVANLVRWIVPLRGLEVLDVIRPGVHPSLYGLVACEIRDSFKDRTAPALLESVSPDSHDEAVALCVHETLRAVAELREGRGEKRFDDGPTTDPSGDAVSETVSVDELLQSLPDALAKLGPTRGLNWIAQLLCEAHRLHRGFEPIRAHDIETLYGRAEKVAASLLVDAGVSTAVLHDFVGALAASRFPTAIHHLEGIAGHLDETSPDLAHVVRQELLDAYRAQLLAARAEDGRLDCSEEGADRDNAVASALAHLNAQRSTAFAVDFLETLYSTLGVSIWDCEERGEQSRRDFPVAANLLGVGAMSAHYARPRDSEAAERLAGWCSDRLWSNELLVSHLESGTEDGRKIDVIGTVVLAMLSNLADGERRVLSLMADPWFPNRGLFAVAKHAEDEEIADEAKRALALRLEAKHSLNLFDARRWAEGFLSIGMPQRGLQAMDLVPPGRAEFTPYDHALYVRLVLAGLEMPDAETTMDTGALSGLLREKYVPARSYLIQQGIDSDIRERVKRADPSAFLGLV